MRRRRALALAATCLILPFVYQATAGAQEAVRAVSTAGPFSLQGARTLRRGESALMAGIGWPSAFFEYDIGVSNRFNLGFRGDLYYGSPFLDFVTAFGGGFSVPMRLHIWGRNRIDLGIGLRPGIDVGESELFGQSGVFRDDSGFAIHLGDPAFLFDITPIDTLTIFARAEVQLALVIVPDADDTYFVSTLSFSGGIELSLSRDLNLFILSGVGPGFAKRGKFDRRLHFRLAIGIELLL
ncbi:MAG: hypothetical protein IT379_35220 [Deltaproteobacteria bacterium]|nr:hypothetical protein [Deltaproteobacteria bacterium]